MLLLSPMFTYHAKNCNSAGARCVLVNVGFLETSTVVCTAGATTADSATNVTTTTLATTATGLLYVAIIVAVLCRRRLRRCHRCCC